MDSLFPLPDQVAEWGTKEQFDACRPQDGQWVHWQDRAEKVLAGRYDEITPLHVELSPTYLCNFSCPWCSCRTARQDWADIDVFSRPDKSDGTVMPPARLNLIVDRLIEARCDIQWVGGEPTMHPGFWGAALRAAEGGLNQCLFTNGSLLAAKRLPVLIEAEFVFVRFSLDAVDADFHRRHHGYAEGRSYGTRVLANIEQAIKVRNDAESSMLVGISFVVDRVNMDDLLPSLRWLCELRPGGRPVDYVIIRPAYPFLGSEVCLDDALIEELGKMVAPGSEAAQRLSDAGIKLVAPPSSFSKAGDAAAAIPPGISCRGGSWFSEIGPTGEMQHCSDRYGDPDSIIGSLAKHDMAKIWGSEQRRRTKQGIEDEQCATRNCPANGRGRHLNATFARIEELRSQGHIDEVSRWIEDLRRHIPDPGHPFFL